MTPARCLFKRATSHAARATFTSSTMSRSAQFMRRYILMRSAARRARYARVMRDLCVMLACQHVFTEPVLRALQLRVAQCVAYANISLRAEAACAARVRAACAHTHTHEAQTYRVPESMRAIVTRSARHEAPARARDAICAGVLLSLSHMHVV